MEAPRGHVATDHRSACRKSKPAAQRCRRADRLRPDSGDTAETSGDGFAAVITDLGMPYVDGRKVATAIKAASPSTPVILLTGWGQRLVSEDDIPAHVDRVLSKPPKLREALVQHCGPAIR
jgi:CheY-like chemotaxis protein